MKSYNKKCYLYPRNTLVKILSTLFYLTPISVKQAQPLWSAAW